MPRYTVLNAPWHLKLLSALYGILMSALWLLFAILMRLTIRVRLEGKDNLNTKSGRIYTFWHDSLLMYFITHIRIREPQIWMQHPVLYMRPIHFTLKAMGVRELAYGSAGHGGQVALDRVVRKLGEGYSTVVAPDGPAGPPHELKPGVLMMASESGFPIIPVTFHASRSIKVPTWDKKILPLPFSTITIHYRNPFGQDELMSIDIQERLTEVLSTGR